MFQPGKYRKDNPDYIFKFIDDHPFASLILQGEELLATHIPVLREEKNQELLLFGHIAQANEQYDFLQDDIEVLLIFHGAHHYVSSSWYSRPDISTWDYSAVHINAKIKIQSEEELKQSLDLLIRKFEKEQKRPLYMHEIPRDLIYSHLPLIKGFWCHPIKIQGIAKLHQGHSRENIDSVIDHLKQSKDPLGKMVQDDIIKEHGKGN